MRSHLVFIFGWIFIAAVTPCQTHASPTDDWPVDAKSLSLNALTWTPALPAAQANSLLAAWRLVDASALAPIPEESLRSEELNAHALSAALPLPPIHRVIQRPPVLDLQTRVKNSENIKYWNFTVYSLQENILWQVESTQALPARMVWEGRDLHGKMLPAGTEYYYQLKILDRQENPGVQVSKPATLKALAYKEKGTRVIDVLSSELFPTDKTLVGDQGVGILNEILFLINEQDFSRLHIRMFDKNLKMARLRGEFLKNKVVQSVSVLPEKVTLEEKISSERPRISFVLELQ
jgi:hypothetical protein